MTAETVPITNTIDDIVARVRAGADLRTELVLHERNRIATFCAELRALQDQIDTLVWYRTQLAVSHPFAQRVASWESVQ